MLDKSKLDTLLFPKNVVTGEIIIGTRRLNKLNKHIYKNLIVIPWSADSRTIIYPTKSRPLTSLFSTQ